MLISGRHWIKDSLFTHYKMEPSWTMAMSVLKCSMQNARMKAEWAYKERPWKTDHFDLSESYIAKTEFDGEDNAMAYDFKKEQKEFYVPKNRPEIVNVPKLNYIAVRGKGNPNEEGGAYQQAISVLYAVAYTLKMSYKSNYKIEGFFEYVVPPLEGFWWQDSVDGVDYSDKSTFNWISVIRLPDFVKEKDFEWAKEAASQKKKLDCSSAEFLAVDEGMCVQMMHLGAYDDEPATVAVMDKFLEENGYENDMNGERLHHEIYLSNAQKVAPEKRKTVIRHPIRKIRRS